MITPNEWAQIKEVIERRVTRTIPSLKPGYHTPSGLTLGDNGLVLKAGQGRSGGTLLVRARLNYDLDITGTSPVHVDFGTTYYDPLSLAVPGPPYNVTIPTDGWYTTFAGAMLEVTPDAADAATFRQPSLRAVVDNIDSDGWCMWQQPVPCLAINAFQLYMGGEWMGFYTAGQVVGVAIFNEFSGGVTLLDGDVATATRFALVQW